MPRCLYCNQEKNEEEFSQEHVIPRAIGGNLVPNNPFSTNLVCRRCNSLCGTYIDGPFIKSWTTQNYRSENILRYANISENPILPLRYMGPIPELNYLESICEFWLGPTGDRIYHFHRPYPEEQDVPHMVGVPSFARRDNIDNGFVFLFIRSNNPIWYPTILRSVNEQFSRSIIFLGNGRTPLGGQFRDIPEDLHDLNERLRNMDGQNHAISIVINTHYGDRFLAKVALGLGGILLHDDFRNSNSADLLRSFMWERTPEARAQIPLQGNTFLGRDLGELRNILNWPNGHVICLVNTGNVLYLYLSIYETQNAVIAVSSQPEHWSGIINEGTVYVIAPGFQRYVGPKNLGQFIAHRIEPDLQDTDLRDLENLISNYSVLPPFDITN